MLKISCAGCLGLSPIISAQFAHKTCVAAQNREKFTKNPYFGNSRSFKVIDVNTHNKLVTSACYDMQHVFAYLQPFFTLDEPIAVKYKLFRGVALFDALFRDDPCHTGARNFVTKI